jgi:hypothetical protein
LSSCSPMSAGPLRRSKSWQFWTKSWFSKAVYNVGISLKCSLSHEVYLQFTLVLHDVWWKVHNRHLYVEQNYLLHTWSMDDLGRLSYLPYWGAEYETYSLSPETVIVL